MFLRSNLFFFNRILSRQPLLHFIFFLIRDNAGHRQFSFGFGGHDNSREAIVREPGRDPKRQVVSFAKSGTDERPVEPIPIRR